VTAWRHARGVERPGRLGDPGTAGKGRDAVAHRAAILPKPTRLAPEVVLKVTRSNFGPAVRRGGIQPLIDASMEHGFIGSPVGARDLVANTMMMWEERDAPSRVRTLRWLCVLVLLAVCERAGRSGLVDPILVPPVSAVLRPLASDRLAREVLPHGGATQRSYA
jgi:hypothetical protein